jgi:hypothetical protein
LRAREHPARNIHGDLSGRLTCGSYGKIKAAATIRRVLEAKIADVLFHVAHGGKRIVDYLRSVKRYGRYGVLWRWQSARYGERDVVPSKVPWRAEFLLAGLPSPLGTNQHRIRAQNMSLV